MKLTNAQCNEYYNGYIQMGDIVDRMLERIESESDEMKAIQKTNMILPLVEQVSESLDPLCENFIDYFENGQVPTRKQIALHDKHVRRVMISIMTVVENAEALQEIVYK